MESDFHKGHILSSPGHNRQTLGQWILARSRRRRKQRFAFFRSAELTYRSGIPVLQFFKDLSLNVRSQVTQSLMKEISGGKTLAQAMECRLDFFLPRDVAWIHFGEQTGKLAHSLRSLLAIMDRENENRKLVIRLLIYPILLVITGIFVLSISRAAFAFGGHLWQSDYVPSSGSLYNIFYVFREWNNPSIQEAIHLAMHSGGSFLLEGFFLLFLIWIALCYGLPIFLKVSGGDRIVDALKMKIPLFNKALTESARGRFFFSLAEGIDVGYPWGNLIHMAAETMGNSYYRGNVIKAARAVEAGTPLSKAFQSLPFLSHDEKLHIQTAEKSGHLDEVFRTLHDDARKALVHRIHVIEKVGNVLALVLGGAFAVVIIGQVYLSYINWAFNTILGQ